MIRPRIITVLLAVALVGTGALPTTAAPPSSPTAPEPSDPDSPVGGTGDFATYVGDNYRAPCVTPRWERGWTDLTRTPGGGMAWSPDGALLALESGGVSSYFRVNQVGYVRLADCAWTDLGSAQGRGLSWSPDGTEIVLVRDNAVTVISATTGETLRTLVSVPAEHAQLWPVPEWRHWPRPAWHPSEDLIAYTDEDGIRVIPSDQPTAEPGPLLVPGGYAPAWSPDGTRLAYGVDDHAAHAAADGTDEVVMPDAQDPRNFSWSPDGQYLAFAGEGEYVGMPSHLREGPCVVLELDGTLERFITNHACTGVAWRPYYEPAPTPDMTLMYLYYKPTSAPPSFHNSGFQYLLHVEPGHVWPGRHSLDPAILPANLCGDRWAVQIDHVVGLPRHRVPDNIPWREMDPYDPWTTGPDQWLGWGTVVTAARHHSMRYLFDVLDCPEPL